MNLGALGVNFNFPWVSHPRTDRGTYVNPYRSQQKFSYRSGWAAQVVGSAGHQTEPASLLGGATKRRRRDDDEDEDERRKRVRREMDRHMQVKREKRDAKRNREVFEGTDPMTLALSVRKQKHQEYKKRRLNNLAAYNTPTEHRHEFAGVKNPKDVLDAPPEDTLPPDGTNSMIDPATGKTLNEWNAMDEQLKADAAQAQGTEEVETPPATTEIKTEPAEVVTEDVETLTEQPTDEVETPTDPVTEEEPTEDVETPADTEQPTEDVETPTDAPSTSPSALFSAEAPDTMQKRGSRKTGFGPAVSKRRPGISGAPYDQSSSPSAVFSADKPPEDDPPGGPGSSSPFSDPADVPSSSPSALFSAEAPDTMQKRGSRKTGFGPAVYKRRPGISGAPYDHSSSPSAVFSADKPPGDDPPGGPGTVPLTQGTSDPAGLTAAAPGGDDPRPAGTGTVPLSRGTSDPLTSSAPGGDDPFDASKPLKPKKKPKDDRFTVRKPKDDFIKGQHALLQDAKTPHQFGPARNRRRRPGAAGAPYDADGTVKADKKKDDANTEWFKKKQAEELQRAAWIKAEMDKFRAGVAATKKPPKISDKDREILRKKMGKGSDADYARRLKNWEAKQAGLLASYGLGKHDTDPSTPFAKKPLGHLPQQPTFTVSKPPPVTDHSATRFLADKLKEQEQDIDHIGRDMDDRDAWIKSEMERMRQDLAGMKKPKGGQGQRDAWIDDELKRMRQELAGMKKPKEAKEKVVKDTKDKDGQLAKLSERIRSIEQAPKQTTKVSTGRSAGAAGTSSSSSSSGAGRGGVVTGGGDAQTKALLAKALKQLAEQKKAKPGAKKTSLQKKASVSAKKAFTAIKKQKLAEINEKRKMALKDAEAKIKQLPKKQQSAARKKAKAAIKKEYDDKKKQIPKSTKGLGLPEIGTVIKRLKVLRV